MYKMWGIILSGIFLVTESIEDIKAKSLSSWVIFAFGIMSVIYSLTGSEGIRGFIINMATGTLVLIFGLATRWKIGMGDGLVIMVLGLYLGKDRVLRIFLTGLFLSAAAGIILIVFKKVKRKTKIPFIPFLTAAFFMDIWMMRSGWI